MDYQGASTYLIKVLDLITNEGKVISLKNIYTEIKLVEDLFSNYISGQIAITDANDLHQIAPIIGEEKIKLIYSTDGSTEVSKVFNLYRIETDQSNSDKVSHNLFIVTEEAMLDLNTKISKAYDKKSIEFMIRDAFSSISSKNVSVTQSSGLFHIVVPNWSPIQFINYTTSIAKPKNYKGSLYFFYEDSKGFNYKHIEDLFSAESVGLWKANKISRNDPKKDIGEINPSNNILSYRILKNSTDTFKAMTDGMYANTTLSYDNVSKTYKTYVYDYNKNFQDTIHLNQFKLSSNNFNLNSDTQKITYLPSVAHREQSQYYKNNIGNTSVADKKEEVHPWRTTLLSQVMAKQIELTVHGNVELTVGKVIDIELPNATALEKLKPNFHRFNRKKVLITKCVNTFSNKVHTMKLIVCDDSYTDTVGILKDFNSDFIDV